MKCAFCGDEDAFVYVTIEPIVGAAGTTIAPRQHVCSSCWRAIPKEPEPDAVPHLPKPPPDPKPKKPRARRGAHD